MISLPKHAGTEPLTLTDIEAKTKTYAAAREALALQIDSLTTIIEKLKRDAMPEIKRLVARCTERHAALSDALTASPELFEKPRTVIFHGIKVGWRKGSGTIDWDDDARLVDRIEKHFSGPQAELLIKTTKKPILAALKDLETAEIRKLGCRVEDTSDVIVIKPTDSEVEKTVNALLKGAIEESETTPA